MVASPTVIKSDALQRYPAAVAGAWAGALRNNVGGNLIYSENTAANPDSNEVLANTVQCNLIGHVRAGILGTTWRNDPYGSEEFQ